MIETAKEATAVKSKETQVGEKGILYTLSEGFIDDIANGVATVVCKNLEGYPDLSNEIQRFLFEEVSGCIEQGLAIADFSQENFEIWYEIDESGVKNS